MGREEYTKCMRPYMTGQKPKEQRKMDFCMGAKLCSGKAKTKEEAQEICSRPKEPKPIKEKGRKKDPAVNCEKSVFELSRCMVDNINMDQASNVNSIEMAIVNSMLACKCTGE